MSLRDFERPSASDLAWKPISWTGGFYRNPFAVPILMILAFVFGEPPHAKFTSVRLGKNVEAGSPDIRTFVSGSNVGIDIAYDYGNGNRLEVVLADRNGKVIDGLASTCSKYILGNQSGAYRCAYLALPPGKYEFVTWLSGQFKEKYLFEVSPPDGAH